MVDNNITVFRGDHKDIPITFTDANSVAINITSYTVFFTVKQIGDTSTDDLSALISKTITSHSDPTNGTTLIELTDTDTDLSNGIYNYDIQIKDDIGKIKTILKSNFIVTNDITKRTT